MEHETLKRQNLKTFFKCGCVVCTLLLLGAAAFHFVAPAVTISGAAETRKIPVYCVDTDKKQVALSFDAAWGNEDTDTLLSILKENNVRTTFFMTGGWVDSYPDDVKKIAAAGHDLGNHSQNHKQMSQLDADTCNFEISEVTKKVEALTGTKMCLFRPPYGDYNNQLIESANALGYHVIQWSVDSLDWKDYGADSIVDTVLNHKNLKDGAIILMHNGAKYTKDALPRVISGLKEKGFEIVPVSELIYTENYHTDNTGMQIKDS